MAERWRSDGTRWMGSHASIHELSMNIMGLFVLFDYKLFNFINTTIVVYSTAVHGVFRTGRQSYLLSTKHRPSCTSQQWLASSSSNSVVIRSRWNGNANSKLIWQTTLRWPHFSKRAKFRTPFHHVTRFSVAERTRLSCTTNAVAMNAFFIRTYAAYVSLILT
jgi:hypothetical protein